MVKLQEFQNITGICEDGIKRLAGIDTNCLKSGPGWGVNTEKKTILKNLEKEALRPWGCMSDWGGT